ncbi:MAG: glycosyltransferase [Candidatus Andersenbacteria bacterium]
MESPVKKLTIQIIGWNSAEHLRDACRALSAIPAEMVQIRYIDNASGDNSVEIIRNALPDADIIELSENVGFVGGHNIAFAKCDTDFVLTHDPDVEIDWMGTQAVLQVFADSKVGAVQGKLMRKNELGGIDSAGIVQTRTLNGKERGAGEPDSGQFNSQAELLAVTGAYGLYRMKTLRELAHSEYEVAGHKALEVFDMDFFAYKDDVDLGWRMNRHNWKVVYEPIFVGTHARTLGKRGKVPWAFHTRGMQERLSSLRTRYSFRNYLWMLIKNMTLLDEIKYDWFILPRIIYMVLLSLLYPPLFTVWGEVLRGLFRMIRKRN